MAAMYRLFPSRLFVAILLAGSAVSLTGCGNFFVCDKASCPSSGSGTGSSSGDYAYVSNSTQGSTYLNGYDVSSGALTALSGFPVNLNYTPVALAISPSNGYLYAGSTDGSIYGYSVGSGGNLSILNSGSAAAVTTSGLTSIDISPDGNYLYALDSALGILYQYQIASTGLLSNMVSFTTSTAQTITPQSVHVSPNGNFVICSLGTAGDAVFPYNSSQGITSNSFATINTGATTTGDFDVAIDTNNYVYVARTGGIAVYSVAVNSTTSVSVSSVSQTNKLSSGAGPHSAVLSSSSGGNAYIGNLTDGTISGYSINAGVLTNLTGSPYTGPAGVRALGRDNSGKYIVAAGYNGTSGIQIFTIGSGGALTAGASAGSGTSTTVPVVMALTHSH